jgi:hypothetical protein
MELNGVKQTFDYGSITDQHKEAVEEVANLARQMGNHTFAEFINHKFNVVEPKRFNVDDSEFYRLCKENGINMFLQGYHQDGIGPDQIEYPVVSITEDIRTMDAFVAKIKGK